MENKTQTMLNLWRHIWTKNKISVVVLVIFIIIEFVYCYWGEPYLLQYYFYKTNGDRVELPYYYIDVPFPEWSIIENDNGYRVMSMNRSYFDFHILTGKEESLDLEEMIKIGEDISTATRKVYSGVEGTKYVSFPDCDYKHILLFVSDDRLFYILKFDYNLTEENENNLDILLNGVRKKNQ